MTEPLTDSERFPLLTESGRQMLHRLREHPHAPKYNYHGGERLTADALERVREYGRRLQSERTGWKEGESPGWLASPSAAATCHFTVGGPTGATTSSPSPRSTAKA
jgi:phenylacetate-CoA ligase